MIQRIQTIWLVLASLCAFLTLNFSFYSGSTAVSTHVELTARYNILTTILTVVVGTLAAISIFLFKNRKLQVRLCLAAIVLQIGCIVLYFNLIKQFAQGNFALGCVLTFAVPVFLILAITGINKDQKLVKSLDRLR